MDPGRGSRGDRGPEDTLVGRDICGAHQHIIDNVIYVNTKSDDKHTNTYNARTSLDRGVAAGIDDLPGLDFQDHSRGELR